MKHYLEALRVSRWPRSASIIVGSGAYWALKLKFSPAAFKLLPKVILAFLLTWAISTANYIINEIADAPYDMHHPDRRGRPFVSGKVKAWVLILIFFVLVTGAFAAGLSFFSKEFNLSLFALLMAGFLYNLKPIRLKDRPFIDSLAESANNPIRFLIGWYAVGQGFPHLLLLAAWWMLGNFLMVGKRLSELLSLGRQQAIKYRSSFKSYTEKSLKLYLIITAFLFSIFFLSFCWLSRLYLTSLSLLFSLAFMYLFYKRARAENVEEPEGVLVKGSIVISALLFFFSLMAGVFLDNINLW